MKSLLFMVKNHLPDPVMQDIQGVYRYLPGELLTYIAKEIGVKEAKAYSVATFYENFSFEQKGNM